jgi:hypothetical protein
VEQLDEDLCHHYRGDLWSARSGTSLARYRGRITIGDGALVRSHHDCCRSSLSLGFAVALALAAVVTADNRSTFDVPPSKRFSNFDADVDRFSNLETGQFATIDARLMMDLIAQAVGWANEIFSNS